MIKQASGLFEGTRGHREAILGGGHVETVRQAGALKVSSVWLGKWTEKYCLTGPEALHFRTLPPQTIGSAPSLDILS